ncbi:hypothetical protein TNCV_253561 [Trichonephila clavipes]|nr:hypothetical protein TNCV_253561 [Trichonephila clavipes]
MFFTQTKTDQKNKTPFYDKLQKFPCCKIYGILRKYLWILTNERYGFRISTRHHGWKLTCPIQIWTKVRSCSYIHSLGGLFSDEPGLTYLLYRDIDTGDTSPVASRPYM